MYDSRRPNSSQRSSQHMESSPREDYYLEEKQKNSPPRNGLRSPLIIGIVMGIIAASIPLIIVYSNASAFSQAALLDQNMSSQTSNFVATWGGCVSLLAEMFMAFVAGALAAKGKRVFLVGALVGVFIAFGYILGAYIPGNPSHISHNTTTNSLVAWLLGFVIDGAVIAVWIGVGGCMSLVGRPFGLWLRRVLGRNNRSGASQG